MKVVLPFILILILACSNKEAAIKSQHTTPSTESYIAILDTIFQTEQTPIRLRDSLMKIFGVESEEAQIQQKIYEQNHSINEKKVLAILDNYGWPEKALIGERGNMILANVLQHADLNVRLKYLPMMKVATKKNVLEARFLVRAEDRIATDQGGLQIYGGQMKYYPATKSFNVWPVFDPVNIDQRRAEIGLIPIAEHLKNRFDFEWNLEEQLKRTSEFEQNLLSKVLFPNN